MASIPSPKRLLHPGRVCPPLPQHNSSGALEGKGQTIPSPPDPTHRTLVDTGARLIYMVGKSSGTYNSNKKWHFTPSDTLNSGADRNCLNPGSWGWVGEERGKRAGEGFLGCLTCPSAPWLHPPPGSTPPAVLWVGSPRGPILSVLLIYFWVLEGKPTKQTNLYYSDNDR